MFLGSENYCVKAIKPENQDFVVVRFWMQILCYGTQLSHANIDHRLLSALMSVSIFSFTVSVLSSFECECLLCIV